MKTVKSVLGALFLLPLALSCSKKDFDTSQQPRGTLLDSNTNGYVKRNEVRSSCDSIPEGLMEYGVDCFKITYVTEFLGTNVKATALVVVPVRDNSQPQRTSPRYFSEGRLAVYCHGTNAPLDGVVKSFSDYSGPGKGKDYNEIRKCILPLASHGYITIVPEYTGYGPTAAEDHPFIYYPELCKSIIDAITASAQFAFNLGINCKKEVFLSGWSQGGGAALATQKYLEDEGVWKVKATTCLAGPFNLEHFMLDVFAHPDHIYGTISLYSWAAYIINRFSPILQIPSDQIFQEKTYDQKAALMRVGAKVNAVFRPAFINVVNNDPDMNFRVAMRLSSFSSGWTPVAPIYLHHGDADPVVPYFNSTDAYDGLTKEGGKVTLYSYKDCDHFAFVAKYMERTLAAFDENK